MQLPVIHILVVNEKTVNIKQHMCNFILKTQTDINYMHPHTNSKHKWLHSLDANLIKATKMPFCDADSLNMYIRSDIISERVGTL